MNVTTASYELDIAAIELTGRLDSLEAGPFRALLAEHIEQGRHRIVVDLSAVDFVDSAGLAALVKGMKDTRSTGGDLRLVSPTDPNALRVFELTRFDKVFAMAPTLSAALGEW